MYWSGAQSTATDCGLLDNLSIEQSVDRPDDYMIIVRAE
jgi:hypothetical protein